jgi:glycosyltransferase involved in cell wall biosynthesis
MADNPLVSIVLTSYNQPKLLEEAFNSLISQTYKNIEVIIVDDCSTNPANKELILKYSSDYPAIVKYILHSKNNGIAKNKNSGFRVAKGDFITYLDGDDLYFPEKIDREVRLFQQKPFLDVVYSNFVFAEPSGKFTNAWAEEKMPEGYLYKEIVKEEFPKNILFRCELIRRDVYERYNFYDEDIKIYHDWDFRIRYGFTCNLGYCNSILSVYRRTDESITIRSSLLKMAEEKLLVIDKNRPLLHSNAHLKAYYKEFKKKLTIGTLFDTSVSFLPHLRMCFLALIRYPSKFITILQSIKHFHLSRIKAKDMLKDRSSPSYASTNH